MTGEPAASTWRETAKLAAYQGFSAAAVAVFAYATAIQLPLLHEAYWAPLAAVVVLYPDREATTKAALERFVGTAVGSVVGWASAALWHQHILRCGLAVFVAVGLCYLLKLSNASRLCAVAVIVITIIPRAEPAHVVAITRFIEVSYGVLCALAYTAASERLTRRAHQRAR